MTDWEFRLASIDEEQRKRFEAAWQSGHPEPIEQYLPPRDQPRFLSTLEELVHIELEYAWKDWSAAQASPPERSRPTPVESYLQRFPELNERTIVLRLLRQEFHVRNRWGDRPSVDDYRRRFPDHVRAEDDLQPSAVGDTAAAHDAAADTSGFDLVQPGSDGALRGQLRVQCPHCRSPIDLDHDAPLRDIDCPACGSAFSLVSETETVSSQAKIRTLGHYQLLDHLGMGQFGSVWRAHDTNLDRAVALKIPRRANLDEELFFREARAAAQLRHPHIVSVHEIGRDNETIYIACDFVQGVNLDQWLRSKRPDFRETARLCLLIAEALQHAHEAGIVHRDLKPSNIMMDVGGQPHLMDFGLARRSTGEITMTVQGQVLGTPAYMPPEQARGEGHTVDGRADIYSLGVVLYQMLTGELPFRGEPRMLRYQILSDDPAPPRRLNSRIPRDLQTICLKCLEKRPDRRYQTAGELAADVRAWLEMRPIKARPLGRFGRAARWCRRRPAVASLLGLVLLVTLVGFSLVTWQWRKADAAFQEANREKQRANQNLDKLLNAVQTMLVEVGGDRLKEEPHMEATRRKLLEEALQYYDYLAHQQGSDPELRLSQGRAMTRAGLMRSWLGEIDAAREAYHEAVPILESLPDGSGQLDLARVHHYLASVEPPPKAREHFELAIQMYDQILDRDPDRVGAKHYLAETLSELAFLQQRAMQTAEAEAGCRRALKLLEEIQPEQLDPPDASGVRSLQARVTHQLAYLVSQSPRLSEAEELYRQALDLWGPLEELPPSQVKFATLLLSQMAYFLDLVDQPEEAMEKLQLAVSMRRNLVDEFPLVPHYLSDLAGGYTTIGYAYMKREQYEDAERAFRDAIAITKKLVDQYPNNWQYLANLANEYNSLGICLGEAERPAAAIEELTRAKVAWERYLAQRPADPITHRSLGAVIGNLGIFLRREGDLKGALAAFEEAVEHQRITLQANPQDRITREFLRKQLQELARVHKRLKQYPEAYSAYSESLQLARSLRDEVGNEEFKEAYLRMSVEMAHFLMNWPAAPADAKQEAGAYAEEALRADPDDVHYRYVAGQARRLNGEHQQAVEALSPLPGNASADRELRSHAAAHLAMAHAGLNDAEAAQQALQLAEQLAAELPKHEEKKEPDGLAELFGLEELLKEAREAVQQLAQ